jgi:L-aspartate oxidase
LGTPFDRDAAGQYVMSREAAHSAARVVRVKGDQAGRQIMETLIAKVRATPSVQVIEGALATGLTTDGDRVTGVWVRRAEPSSEKVLIETPAVLLAGGGSGGLYAHTTNPPRIRGQVIGFAARAGAVIADPEFVQFHPTAIDMGEDPMPLATEALRGEGAILINRQGERFMTDVHKDAELAPRDIVAREIFSQTQAGNRPMLDTRAALGEEVLTRFPAVAEACARAGLNPVEQPIPVAVAAHYHMGGVDTDEHGRSSLSRLWVCGEASSTGLHGANRLASNGLLEALVYARKAAEDIAASLPDAPAQEEVRFDWIDGGEMVDEALVSELRETMNAHVAVRRNAAGLKTALADIARIEAAADTETMRNMTATATLIAAAALEREESRGGHFRDDFPDPVPALAHRTKITLEAAMAIRDAAKETA